MKKLIFTLFSFCLLATTTNAQYCGNSGSTICLASGNLTKPGLSPASDSLPSVINGVISTTVIQFKNFDTIKNPGGGAALHLNSLRIDTISNLPAGLCWATNRADNTFQNQQDGCIKINGTTCATPGQYKLRIIVTVNVGVSLQTNADAAGLKYFVRVKNSGDADIQIDSTQTASNPFIASGPAAVCGTGISTEAGSNINSLSVVPNPFNNKALVSFYADKAGVMTERITNMIGSEVYNKELVVKMGENNSQIERNNLPVGVYFYSISDGKSLSTKRIIISE